MCIFVKRVQPIMELGTWPATIHRIKERREISIAIPSFTIIKELKEANAIDSKNDTRINFHPYVGHFKFFSRVNSVEMSPTKIQLNLRFDGAQTGVSFFAGWSKHSYSIYH